MYSPPCSLVDKHDGFHDACCALFEGLVSPFQASAHRQQHLSGIHHVCKTVVILFRINKIASVFYTERSV